MKNATGDVSRQILTRLSLEIDMPAIFFRSLPKYYKQVGRLHIIIRFIGFSQQFCQKVANNSGKLSRGSPIVSCFWLAKGQLMLYEAFV